MLHIPSSSSLSPPATDSPSKPVDEHTTTHPLDILHLPAPLSPLFTDDSVDYDVMAFMADISITDFTWDESDGTIHPTLPSQSPSTGTQHFAATPVDDSHTVDDCDPLDGYITDLQAQYNGTLSHDLSHVFDDDEEVKSIVAPSVTPWSPPASPPHSNKRSSSTPLWTDSPRPWQRPRLQFRTPPSPTITNKSSKTERAQAALIAVWDRIPITKQDVPAVIDGLLSSNANLSNNPNLVAQIHDIITEFNANSKYLLRVLTPRLLEAAVSREKSDMHSTMWNVDVWKVADGRINRGAAKAYFVENVLGLTKSEVCGTQTSKLNLKKGQALLKALLEYDPELFVQAYPRGSFA
jgi:hypothetical protein